jgi:hypothetical protein
MVTADLREGVAERSVVAEAKLKSFNEKTNLGIRPLFFMKSL